VNLFVEPQGAKILPAHPAVVGTFGQIALVQAAGQLRIDGQIELFLPI
jgi:hypothetical protein